MTSRKLTWGGFGLLATLALFGCSSSPQVDLSAGTNPQAKMTETEGRLQAATDKQYDQLSPRHFREAQSALKEAHKLSEKGAPSTEILEEVGKAIAEVQIVENNGKRSAAVLETTLSARTAAKNVKADSLLPKEFRSADEDLQSLSGKMEDNTSRPSAADISKLEGVYAGLELLALKHSNLGEARSLIEQAEKNGAKRKAPATYSAAQVQYDSAARAIEANRRSPESYEPAVQQSLASARKLNAVLKTVVDSKSSEAAAVQIFDQAQQLAANRAELRDAGRKEKNDSRNMAALQGENQRYADKAALEAKIAEMKKTFKPSEAEVVQDGEKITVRLKSMKFQTARFEFSSESLDTLQKVKELILAVPVESVVVEGHTDSVGTPDANMTLSQKRADAVAKYFVSSKTLAEGKVTAKGFGYEKPLTPNKSKEGRATNRRVDIVIQTTTI